MMCWQLMQPCVQKSSSTILPRNFAKLSGSLTLNHVSPDGNSGAGFSTGGVSVGASVGLAAEVG